MLAAPIMLQTSANPTRRINVSSGFYYAVLPSFAGRPFILVTRPYSPCAARTCAPASFAYPVYGCAARRRRTVRVDPRGALITRPVTGFRPHVWVVLSIYRRRTCRCRWRREAGARTLRGPHGSGMLIAMQIASALATSADIDPPAELQSADRWTVTSE